jgi:hypothetical protein
VINIGTIIRHIRRLVAMGFTFLGMQKASQRLIDIDLLLL